MKVPFCHKCVDGLFALNVYCPHKSQTFMGCRRDSRITDHAKAHFLCPIIVAVPVSAKPVKNPKRKVVNHMTRLTPTEWCHMFGVQVIDPDGWRGSWKPDWNTRITRDMFKARYQVSTCCIVDKTKYAQWRHFLG